MALTYLEQEQRVLLLSSRGLINIACRVLDDVENEHELLGQTHPWAKDKAVALVTQAREIETRAIALTYYSPNQSATQRRAWSKYSDSVTHLLSRVNTASKERERREEDRHLPRSLGGPVV